MALSLWPRRCSRWAASEVLVDVPVPVHVSDSVVGAQRRAQDFLFSFSESCVAMPLYSYARTRRSLNSENNKRRPRESRYLHGELAAFFRFPSGCQLIMFGLFQVGISPRYLRGAAWLAGLTRDGDGRRRPPPTASIPDSFQALQSSCSHHFQAAHKQQQP